MVEVIGKRAMILAAGLGTRMRPLTDSTPKPLIKVAGRALIDWSKDNLTQGGIDSIIVNKHYLAEQIDDWAGRQPAGLISISDERDQLLETGGGVIRALPMLGTAPFFILNSDSFWLNGDIPAIERMRQNWDDGKMDFLLLLSDKTRAIGFSGAGDFFMSDEGRLQRRGEANTAPYIYAGGYLVHPRILAGQKPVAFSMNRIFDKALGKGRLFGLLHDAPWLHVGTPEAIRLAEDELERFAELN